jgi:hypothetical protein
MGVAPPRNLILANLTGGDFRRTTEVGGDHML